MAEVHTDFWVVAGTTGPVLLAAHLVAVERARRVILQLVPGDVTWTWRTALKGNRIQAVIAVLISVAILLAGIVTAANASFSAFEALGAPEMSDAKLGIAVSQLKFSLVLFVVQGTLPMIYPFFASMLDATERLTNTDAFFAQRAKTDEGNGKGRPPATS